VKQSLKTIDENDNRLHQYVKHLPSVKSKSTFEGEESLLYQGNDPGIIKKLFNAFHQVYCPELLIDETNEGVVDYLIDLAAGQAPKPGLVIRGNVGTGKTLLVLTYIRFLQLIIKPEVNVVFIDASELMQNFFQQGFSFFNQNFRDILIIDDLGIPTQVNYYGTNINIAEQLIMSRYKFFKKIPSQKLICTTNLVYNDLVSEIGERAMSRIDEMCAWNQGALVGNDRRKNHHLGKWPKCVFGSPISRFDGGPMLGEKKRNVLPS
jgi:hypothetical protein